MDNAERRRHIRLDIGEKLFVQIVSAEDAQELVGKTYFCKTVDVSETGLKITVQQEVPKNCEVELWVQMQSTAKKYFLFGHTQWCIGKPQDNGNFEMGIKLKQGDKSDFQSWQYLFDNNINNLLHK